MRQGHAEVELARYMNQDGWRLRVTDGETRKVVVEIEFGNVGAADLISNHTVTGPAKWYAREEEDPDV